MHIVINLNLQTIDNPQMQKTNFSYNPYSNLCGLNPIKPDGMETTSRINNRNIERITKDKTARQEYYKNVTGMYNLLIEFKNIK